MRFLASFFLLFTFTLNAAKANELKVLSWNVFMLPKPIKYSWQKYRTNLIQEELKKVDHEVLFFQEAFTGGFHKALRKSLGDTFPHSYYLKKRSFYYPMGSGVLVMSKYPFKVVDKIYYKRSSCSGADCFASKGVVLVEINLPSGKVVQFANTHLQSGESDGHKRMIQVEQIRAMLKKHERAGVPQFLVGDLNIDSVEPEFHQALDVLQMDYAELQGPILYTNHLKNDCYKTAGDGIHHEWIDHIWSSGANAKKAQMQVKVMDFDYHGVKCPLSDHHAVEATIPL